jgi:ubiquinone/menaquinone biosynthesis C-methylase UbiE
MNLFLKLLDVTKNKTILDLGGTSQMWHGTGFERNVTLLNLTSLKPEDIKQGFKCIQGDALNMYMIENNEFDLVFSNSVIEHVGSFENQKQFANEILNLYSITIIR